MCRVVASLKIKHRIITGPLFSDLFKLVAAQGDSEMSAAITAINLWSSR